MTANSRINKDNSQRKDIFLKRIHEIDFARGFLILLVVIDHLMFNIKSYFIVWFGESNGLYQFADFYLNSTARDIIQPICLMLFCFISGISCVFSRNNLKRGLMTTGVALLLTLVTRVTQLIVNSNGGNIDIAIDLNIIGVLGLSMITYALIEKRSYRMIYVLIIFSLLMSSYVNPILRGSLLRLCGGWSNDRPGVDYGINGTPNFFMPLFWEYPHTADFVPLFPYMMAFFLGAIFSYYFYKEKRTSLISKRGNWERPICFIGRHTFVIYLAHIVVITGIFVLINLIVTGGGMI